MGWECNGHSVCLIVERIILQFRPGHVYGGPLRRNSEKMCEADKETSERVCMWGCMRLCGNESDPC